ncbi:hypothetical protein [Streptomyces sp. NPDC001135]
MTGRTSPARTPRELDRAVTGGIGDSPLRPGGTLEVSGEHASSFDLWAEGMLGGAALRSSRPCAGVTSIGMGPAVQQPGVHAVLTLQGVPGENVHGQGFSGTPVLAEDVVRHQGEPAAVVAGGHPERARRAVAGIVVGPEVLEPVTDPERAAHDDTLPGLHPGGDVVRHQPVTKGDPGAGADVVVSRHGGDRGQGRQDPQPVVRRLPDPDGPGHAADDGARDREDRPRRAVRRARGRRTAHRLRHPGRRERRPQRAGSEPHPHPGHAGAALRRPAATASPARRPPVPTPLHPLHPSTKEQP